MEREIHLLRVVMWSMVVGFNLAVIGIALFTWNTTVLAGAAAFQLFVVSVTLRDSINRLKKSVDFNPTSDNVDA